MTFGPRTDFHTNKEREKGGKEEGIKERWKETKQETNKQTKI